MLHVRFEEKDGALVVTPLVRRIDAEVAPGLRDVVAPAAETRRVVIVSLRHVHAVDASGLAALVAVLRRMPPGGELRLAEVPPRVRALLSLTRLDEVFPLDDAPSALPA
jgi:anti-sigma B factor antagonist